MGVPARAKGTELKRPPKSQNKYSVLVLLNFKPTPSNLCHHTSNLLWASRPLSETANVGKQHTPRGLFLDV